MSSTGEGRKSSRVWFIVATVVIAVLVFASGMLVSGLVSASKADDAPSAPTHTTRPAKAQRPLPKNQPPAELTGPNPTSCEKIYSPEMLQKLQATGMPLNDPSVQGSVGTKDDELRAVIESHKPLNCSWGYAGDFGLTTSIVRLDADTVKSVIDRMGTLGYRCEDESGGTRCLVAFTQAGNRYGESHFIRDGVWLATSWVNYAPANYTPDIVAILWPDTAGSGTGE
ncbi:hypothetical protein SAMN04489806_0475 [Paramicrobacterium humi]|uniref:Uncharacterized protein n=1 Tax=Paramicrobacterium humi TaxID=640635 RepID=A0A1H4J406_9MICO|nr:hypothetical protein [Microbacterium humi]SEB40951.1 hypothetical protein SAMN04489806_0475 [Microbacterium humi]